MSLVVDDIDEPWSYRVRYKGITFDSRLEAWWASAMDEIGMHWVHHPGRVQLSDGRCYEPDFLLDNDVILEVKGNHNRRIDKLSLTPNNRIVIGRQPQFHTHAPQLGGSRRHPHVQEHCVCETKTWPSLSWESPAGEGDRWVVANNDYGEKIFVRQTDDSEVLPRDVWISITDRAGYTDTNEPHVFSWDDLVLRETHDLRHLGFYAARVQYA